MSLEEKIQILAQAVPQWIDGASSKVDPLLSSTE